MQILVYDALCHKCAAAAQDLHAAGKGRFEILSIQSPQARELLDQAFPRGWTRDVYYLEVSSGDVRAYRGPRAAWKLMTQTGFRDFWKATKSLVRVRPTTRVDTTHGIIPQRRNFLKLVTYGAFYMGLGALIGRAGLIDVALGKALAGSGGCSKQDIGVEESQRFSEIALGDEEMTLLRGSLLGKGFIDRPDEVYLSRVRCDTEELTAASFPLVKENQNDVDDRAISVFVSTAGGTRAFGATFTETPDGREVRHLRVIGGEVREIESGSATAASFCDWPCYFACTANDGYSFWSNCMLTCGDGCPLWWSYDQCAVYCRDLCNIQTQVYCCGLCNCDPCPV